MRFSDALKARIQSFIWRLGGVMAIAGLNWLAVQIGLFNLSPEWVTVMGLVIGEVTKFINVNLPQLQ